MAAVNFPNSPSVNDTHTSSGSTWKWDGTVWQRLGEAGPQGAQGHQGHQGVQGATGAQGHQGRQGAIGAQGSVGIASLTIATSPPGSPDAGDMWWDSDDGDLHLYYNDGNSSQWANINNGPAGAQGAQGVQGTTGPTGAQGHQGVQGAQGRQGAQGATGAQGHQGVQGTSGATTTINNNAANRIITGSGSANTLNGNTFATWNGNNFALRGGEGENCTIELASDEGDDNADFWRMMAQASDNALAIDNYSSGSWVEKARIDSSGWFGFGQTSQDNAGQVAAFKHTDNANSWLSVNVNNNTGVAGIVFGDSDSWNAAYIQYNHTNNIMEFVQTGALRLSINASGDLNIGTAGRFDASGLVKSAHGTASAPSHTFLNDPDNGMFRPTTNTIAFSTGGNERVRIDASGRLFVNTTTQSISSSELFEVKSTGSGFSHFRNNSGSTATIYIDNEYSDTGFAPFLTFTDGGGNRGGIGQDQADLLRLTGQGGLSVYTNGTHGGGTEAFRISQTGKVGIATDNPYAPLSLRTAAETSSSGNFADNGILLHAPGATDEHVIPISASFVTNAHLPRCGIGFISHPTVDPSQGYAGEIGFYTHDAADGSGLSPSNERARITRQGKLLVNGINYIEAADFRIQNEGTNWLPSNGGDMRFQQRINSNTSLISLTNNAERITFSKACHVLVTVSQDIFGNTDTGYWYIIPKVNGTWQSYQLVRKTTQWDNLMMTQYMQVPANGYIHFACYFTNVTGLNIDWGSWSVTAWPKL